MDCLDEDSVIAFLDGEVDEVRRAEIQTHLADCPPCADLIATSAGGSPEMLARHTLEEALSMSLAPGTTVGPYVILSLVGRGGMGEVYAAYDPRLERKVALKVLRESPGPRAKVRAAQRSLLQEAQSTARLSHPNVVIVYDAGTIDDEASGVRVYLAMEFVEGQTLAQWLSSQPRSWREIRDVFLAAAQGLLAAHEAGLVHRDFKPQNVMIAGNGSIRVMDFGLASASQVAADEDIASLRLAQPDLRPASQTVPLTGAGALMGTPLYMAPEQFQGRPTDARTDQFGFCVALYEALYGTRPFAAETVEDLRHAVLSGRPREPDNAKQVPGFLRRVVLRGMRTTPAARYPSMRELIAALATDPARRRRIVSWGVAAAMILLVVGLGAQRLAAHGQTMCRAAGDKMEGVWEPRDDGPRRTAVHQAFARTGKPLAATTWPRVARLLDAYTSRWTAAYTDACEATHVRGDQSTQVLDLRMGCLEQARGAVRALTEVLSNADDRAIVEAVNAAQALPPLERCADVMALKAVVPPPADPSARAHVTEIETGLSRVKALIDTGKWVEARRQVGPVVDAARAMGYGPLVAETLESRSWLETELLDEAAGRDTLEEAVWIALESHRDDIAAESAAQRLAIAATLPEPAERTARWDALAAALISRLGPGHERIESWFHQNRAVLAYSRGQFRDALTELGLALALKRKVLPPTSPDIAITLGTIAYVRATTGHGQSALVLVQEAEGIFREAYGAESPFRIRTIFTRGAALEAVGRFAEAEADFLDATRALEPDSSAHVHLADILTELGKTLVAEHKYQEAATILERAVHLREQDPGSPIDRAEVQFALARAHWALNRARPRAVQMAMAARDIYHPLPDCRSRTDEINAWLAGKFPAPTNEARTPKAGSTTFRHPPSVTPPGN